MRAAKEFLQRIARGDRDFRAVNLRGANLSGATLTAARFIEAEFSGADLSGADLSDALRAERGTSDSTPTEGR